MEGPSMRSFPRMMLLNPLELRLAKRAIRLKKARGNLSAGGLFVEGQDLPVGTSVVVKIGGPAPVEVEGVVRFREGNGHGGVGIEFTAVDQSERRHLDELIRDLTRQGAPVC